MMDQGCHCSECMYPDLLVTVVPQTFLQGAPVTAAKSEASTLLAEVDAVLIR